MRIDAMTADGQHKWAAVERSAPGRMAQVTDFPTSRTSQVLSGIQLHSCLAALKHPSR